MAAFAFSQITEVIDPEGFQEYRLRAVETLKSTAESTMAEW